jgi:hypothetical protein
MTPKLPTPQRSSQHFRGGAKGVGPSLNSGIDGPTPGAALMYITIYIRQAGAHGPGHAPEHSIRSRVRLAFIPSLCLALASCASGPRRIPLPIPTRDSADFHRDIEGRRVDVRFLSAPVRVLPPGVTVYELRSVSGRAHLEDLGATTNLLVGSDVTIPLERVREVDANSRPLFSAIGGGLGLASAVAFGVIKATTLSSGSDHATSSAMTLSSMPSCLRRSRSQSASPSVKRWEEALTGKSSNGGDGDLRAVSVAAALAT